MKNQESKIEIARLRARRDVLEFEIQNKVYARASVEEIAPLYVELGEIIDRIVELLKGRGIPKREN